MRVTFDKYDAMASLSELKRSKHQRNKHPDDQIERLAKIMREHGVRQPIGVSKLSGEVCFGHGRWAAALKNGWTKFPVVYQQFENDDEEYACVQSDNAIAAWSELDLSAIMTDVQGLGADFDLELLGLKDFKLPVALEPGCDEDDIPEDVEPQAKLGDVYQLGRHRLVCGSCTDQSAVDTLFQGKRAGMTFTSPPYNAGKQGFLDNLSKQKYLDGGDARDDSDYLNLLKDATSLALAYSDYVFVNLQLLSHSRLPLVDYQHHFRTMLKDVFIWNKSQCPPNIVKGAFNTKWEYVFCFSESAKNRGFPVEWQGKYPNVVETESNSRNEFADVHKAGFPVAFPLWFFGKLDLGDVYEPFCGTGTTIIACEKVGRSCYAIELDPKYVDVIVARWEKYTGQKAELLTPEADSGQT